MRSLIVILFFLFLSFFVFSSLKVAHEVWQGKEEIRYSQCLRETVLYGTALYYKGVAENNSFESDRGLEIIRNQHLFCEE